MIDSDGNGYIDSIELMKNLKFFGFAGKNPQVKKEVKNVMDDCCSNNGKSLTLVEFVHFCDKLEEGKYTEKWKHYEKVHENMIGGGEILEEIWKNASKKSGQHGDSLPWNDFCEFFSQKLGVDISHNKNWQKVLEHFFNIESSNTIQIINKKYFRIFKNIFSSLFPSSPKEGTKFLDSICELYNQDFYFGYLSRDQSEMILKESEGKAFLVRISENVEALVFSSPHTDPEHQKIEHEHYRQDGGPLLLKYIEENFYSIGIVGASSKKKYFKQSLIVKIVQEIQ